MLDKKEIKRKYKESVTPMGIYRFRNKRDGKYFLGSSLNLPGKKNSIEFQLKMGSHMNAELQEDFNRLGRDSFEFEILDELEPKEGAGYNYSDDLEALLSLWVEKLELNVSKCYNTIFTNPDGVKTIR